MREEKAYANREPYDAVVIGAGLCGIIFLKYAREQRLRCIALEKESDVGGVWNWLPSWQDIQNRKQDFAIDDVPLHGVKQAAIHEYARAWVRKFDLDPFIKLGREVTSVSRIDDGWTVRTNHGEFRTRYLIVASGVQNEPRVPDVDRSHSDILEKHSSDVRRPENLADSRVTIVGGGASSWDLLDLAIEHGARDIHWVYRNIKWFLPTRKTKHTAWPNLRELSLVQTVRRSTEGVTSFLRWLLRMRYDALQLTELEPAEPFDIRKHQLIPGRSLMCQNLDVISRHQSEIRQMRGREITLGNGVRFETDTVLWATGYRMNLAYLDLPAYCQIETLNELFPKLGSLVRSIDYPNLFFVGMTLIESTSATPFFAAVQAKSIVAHISGDTEIPRQNIPHHIAHWDLSRYFASFDRANYPTFWWRIKYSLLALWYAVFQNRSVKV